MELFPVTVTIIYGLIPLNLQLFQGNSSYSFICTQQKISLRTWTIDQVLQVVFFFLIRQLQIIKINLYLLVPILEMGVCLPDTQVKIFTQC